jgi:hypothetical protein
MCTFNVGALTNTITTKQMIHENKTKKCRGSYKVQYKYEEEDQEQMPTYKGIKEERRRAKQKMVTN